MSLRPFFAKERSRARVLFCAVGVCLMLYALWHIWHKNWGVASFLGVCGLLSVSACAVLSEGQLRTVATAFVLVNVVVAAAALLFGVRVQSNLSANTDPHLHKAASPRRVWPGCFKRYASLLREV